MADILIQEKSVSDWKNIERNCLKYRNKDVYGLFVFFFSLSISCFMSASNIFLTGSRDKIRGKTLLSWLSYVSIASS